MTNLAVVEYNNRRVLTSNQLAEAYETDTQIITNNFNRNKKRYLQGKHYYGLQGAEKQDFINQNQIDLGSKNAKIIYLWTQNGTLLHAKSLNTDKAWEVYQNLVDFYFNVREEHIPKIDTDTNNQFQEMFDSFQKQLSEHTKILESLQQEKIQDKQTISTLQSDLKYEKRQIHMNPIMEKRSRIYEELQSELFYNEFNNTDTAETYNMALKVLKATYIKDIFATANFMSDNNFNKNYCSLDWAIAVLKVGYTILHCCDKDIYHNIASKNLLFYKDVNQKFCDEYEEAFIPAEKQSYLHEKIISKLPQGIEMNGKILNLCYFKALDTINHRVNIRLNPTHMKVDSNITLNEYLMMLDISMKKINNIIKK